ncbi:MAG: prephenate dehydrogenase/arogenate dehydrogenase family protein, partial [Burkholderiales bacterium]
ALFDEIRHVPDPQAIVTDCGSTKRSVIDAARRALGDAFIRYVPGHPIAGSERSGPQAADPDLFRGRRWLLCPLDATPQQHCEAVTRLLEPTGAQVSTLDPSLHARVFAEVSHWPHAAAFGLSPAIDARGRLVADDVGRHPAGQSRRLPGCGSALPRLQRRDHRCARGGRSGRAGGDLLGREPLAQPARVGRVHTTIVPA